MVDTVELDRFLASVEKRAFKMALVSIGHPEDALDIVQDVMLTLANKYHQRPSSEWPPLFFRILRNRITDFRRRRTIKRRLFAWWSSDDEADADVQTISAPASTAPLVQAGSSEFGEQLLIALQQLPARQRDTFMLRAWQGLDVKETASAMRCSEGTVKTQYSRAVHTLREMMQEFDDE